MNPLIEEMNKGNVVSTLARQTRNVVPNKIRDKVPLERLDNPFTLTDTIVGTYLEFSNTARPANPLSGFHRLYTKSTGAQTDLFILDSAGNEQELLSSSSLTLDTAYNNGSTIDVDVSDLTLSLTAGLGLNIVDDATTNAVFQVRNTGVTISVTQLHELDNEIRLRDSTITLSSQNDGYMDLGADLGFRFNTGQVGIGGTPNATLHIQTAASTGAVNTELLFENAGHTATTAATERIIADLDFSNEVEFNTGALALQRTMYIRNPVYGFTGASILTSTATVSISGAPSAGTNATITNSHAFYIESADVATVGSTTNSWGLSVNAQTGATNNYSAQFLGGLVKFDAGRYDSKTTATIASGAVTVTGSYMQLDTEGAAATDDLDTLNGGEIGMEVTIEGTNAARVITVKDSGGNFYLEGDCVLDSPRDKITLIKAAANEWHEKCRSNNA